MGSSSPRVHSDHAAAAAAALTTAGWGGEGIGLSVSGAPRLRALPEKRLPRPPEELAVPGVGGAKRQAAARGLHPGQGWSSARPPRSGDRGGREQRTEAFLMGWARKTCPSVRVQAHRLAEVVRPVLRGNSGRRAGGVVDRIPLLVLLGGSVSRVVLGWLAGVVWGLCGNLAGLDCVGNSRRLGGCGQSFSHSCVGVLVAELPWRR